MLKTKLIALLSGAVLAAGAVPAAAQETVIVDEDDIVVRERVIEPDDDDFADDDDRYGPRVYGWADERPLDCGAYHYWDGEDCVDARHIPPDTGYKD